MVERLRVFWTQHRNPKYLFPDIGRAWKEKYGEAKLALKDSIKPMSDSSVQNAMRMGALHGLTLAQVAQHLTMRRFKCPWLLSQSPFSCGRATLIVRGSMP